MDLQTPFLLLSRPCIGLLVRKFCTLAFVILIFLKYLLAPLPGFSLLFLAAAFVPFPSPSLSISISPCLSASYESVRALTGLAAGCSAKRSGGLWGWTLNNCQSSLSFIQQVARRKERNYCRNGDISWCLHLYLNRDVLPLVNAWSTAGDGF